MDDTQQFAWDPIQKNTICSQTYQVEQQDLMNKLQQLRSKQNLMRNLILLLCIPVAVLLVMAMFHDFIFQLFAVGFAPAFMYYSYIRNLQEEILLSMICEKYGWVYNPKKDTERPSLFSSLLPKIFDFGYDRNLDEQIWGNITHNDKTTAFWSSKFEYTTGSGKSRHTYHTYIFAFKLAKPVLENFTLGRPGLLRMFEGSIKTESVDFNNTFQIEGYDNDIDVKSKIIQILSPSVQTRLIDFAKSYSTDKIVFQDEMMVIVLPNKLWKTQYTDLFKQVAIDERDENLIYTALMNMAELPTEIIQFIPKE
jgi:hypothetical protein